MGVTGDDNIGVDLGEKLRSIPDQGLPDEFLPFFEFPVAALPLLPLVGDDGTLEIADPKKVDPAVSMMPFVGFTDNPELPLRPIPDGETTYGLDVLGSAPHFQGRYGWPGFPLGLIIHVKNKNSLYA